MLSVTSVGQIRLSRGDSFQVPFYINQGTGMDPLVYVMIPEVEFYFAVMEPNQPWEQAIIKKRYTVADTENDAVILQLEPQDTMCLLPGLYYYQIKLRIYDHHLQKYVVNTLCPKMQFWIEE